MWTDIFILCLFVLREFLLHFHYSRVLDQWLHLYTAVIKPRLSIILHWVVNTSLRDTQYSKAPLCAHHYALINVSFLYFKCTYISIYHTCWADCTRSTPIAYYWLTSLQKDCLMKRKWAACHSCCLTAAFQHEIWIFSCLELAVRC